MSFYFGAKRMWSEGIYEDHVRSVQSRVIVLSRVLTYDDTIRLWVDEVGLLDFGVSRKSYAFNFKESANANLVNWFL
jgi:hypothetical protein